MSYDPFSRGPYPVGVRTTDIVDSERNRPLSVEVWYPALDTHVGQDTSPATRDSYDLIPGFPSAWQEAVRDAAPRAGKYPLVAFSHGFGGHRRQSTFLCTHLASRGYVVAAPDHTGNTIFDMIQWMMTVQSGGELPDLIGLLDGFIGNRPVDIRFTIDGVLSGSIGGIAALVDAERIGMSGHSFGGWTTLMVAGRDPRIRAALPLAPAGGKTPLPADPLRDALDFNWGREVPTLFLVADGDSILPLPGMHELLERTPSKAKRMLILENADHMHFCDRIEEIHELFRMMPPPIFDQVAGSIRPISELCPADHAYQFVRGLGLAHMDAHLKGDEAAARFLSDDLATTLRSRGISATTV